MTDFTGTASAETFTGEVGSDLISGGGGADTLNGSGGDDFIASDARAENFGAWYGRVISIDTGRAEDALQGGDGDDHLYAGFGDSVDGGSNSAFGDYLSISFMGASSGVTVDFSLLSQTIGGGTIENIENLTWVQGSNFADTINAEDRSTGYTEFNQVFGMGGNDRLTAGYYTRVLDGGNGNDTIDGSLSQYIATVDGGDGRDTIILRGGQPAVVYGGAGADDITAGSEIHGGDGNDAIHVITTYYAGFVHGDAGDDRIDATDASQLSTFGGAGADTVIGSANRDAISTDAAPDLITQQIHDDNRNDHDAVAAGDGDDLIAAGIGDDVDGGAGTDTLRLSLAGSATRLSFSTAGLLSNTGTFLGGTIRNVENVAWLGGSAFADRITVAGRVLLPQVIDGGGGADTFFSAGQDVELRGGDGNDRLMARAAGGVFDGGEGVDSVTYVRSNAGVSVQMADSASSEGQLLNVERVSGSGFADAITGDSLANSLGGGAGDDTLQGGGGDDTLDGGAGSDHLEGGTGDDIYLVGDALDAIVEALGGGIDTVKTGFDHTLGAELENLVLTGTGDVAGTGNALGNVLEGNAGANVLNGLGGDDVLVGGAGLDRMDGGEGSDVYVVKAASEQSAAEIFDSGSRGTDEIRFASTTAGTFVPLASNTGIEAITIGTGTDAIARRAGTAAIDIDASDFGNALILRGNAGANHLRGTAFGDTLDGGAGADLLTGGQGNDTYRVDTALDTIEEVSGEGTDTVIAEVSWTLGNNLEELRLVGAATIGTGNGGANRIEGNALDNVLEGGGDTDVLLGAGGNDILRGGAGADSMDGGVGNDTYFVEGAGDTIVETADGGFDRAFGSESLTLGANVEVGVATGTAAISITGSSTDNALGGNAAANTLSGNGGRDDLFGRGGADTLQGGDGDDFLFGGQGTDTLTGGAGADQFAISTAFGEGVDRISDFVSGTDTILVANAYVSGYLLAGGLVFGTSARDQDDIAIYDRNSGNLWVDYDGNGSQAKVLLATFTPGTTIAASDFVLIEQSAFNAQIQGIEALFLV